MFLGYALQPVPQQPIVERSMRCNSAGLERTMVWCAGPCHEVLGGRPE